MELDELLSRRLILVTGKGGVGKTTLSASLALVAARKGRRVLICEVEGPSQVARLFDAREGGHQPKPIAPGVDLAILSPEEGIRSYLADKIRLSGVVDLVFKQQAISRFFRAAPAFSEMGVLYAISRFLGEGRGNQKRWDHVVVDLPASGHTIGMLEAPFVGKRIFRAGPVRALCESVEQMLLDHELATSLVVTLPEELPINEALDLATKLRGRGLRIEAVLANAVEGAALGPEEEALLQRLVGKEQRLLLQGAAAASRRAAKGASLVRRLAEGLRSPPVPIPFRLARGSELVREIADELEKPRPKAPPKALPA